MSFRHAEVSPLAPKTTSRKAVISAALSEIDAIQRALPGIELTVRELEAISAGEMMPSSFWLMTPAGLALSVATVFDGLIEAMKITCEGIDHDTPSGSGSLKRQILVQMRNEIPDVRPAVLGSELFEDLVNLHRFRRLVQETRAKNVGRGDIISNAKLLLAIVPKVREAFIACAEWS